MVNELRSNLFALINQDFSFCLSQLTQTFDPHPLIPTSGLFHCEKFSSPFLLGPLLIRGPRVALLKYCKFADKLNWNIWGLTPLTLWHSLSVYPLNEHFCSWQNQATCTRLPYAFIKAQICTYKSMYMHITPYK